MLLFLSQFLMLWYSIHEIRLLHSLIQATWANLAKVALPHLTKLIAPPSNPNSCSQLFASSYQMLSKAS